MPAWAASLVVADGSPLWQAQQPCSACRSPRNASESTSLLTSCWGDTREASSADAEVWHASQLPPAVGPVTFVTVAVGMSCASPANDTRYRSPPMHREREGAARVGLDAGDAHELAPLVLRLDDVPGGDRDAETRQLPRHLHLRGRVARLDALDPSSARGRPPTPRRPPRAARRAPAPSPARTSPLPFSSCSPPHGSSRSRRPILRRSATQSQH